MFPLRSQMVPTRSNRKVRKSKAVPSVPRRNYRPYNESLSTLLNDNWEQ